MCVCVSVYTCVCLHAIHCTCVSVRAYIMYMYMHVCVCVSKRPLELVYSRAAWQHTVLISLRFSSMERLMVYP